GRRAERDVLQRASARRRPARRRVVVGLRHAPGVGELPRERMRARERDDGAPQAVLGGASGREEARGAARDAQVLDRGGVALGMVAVDKRFARLAGGDERELPAEVARVLDAVVAAARAERADDVRRVANEDRAADAKRVEQVVAVLVRADPDELELDVGAELRAQALP